MKLHPVPFFTSTALLFVLAVVASAQDKSVEVAIFVSALLITLAFAFSAAKSP